MHAFCPYARIQGAMIDKQTVVPTYDLDRGEPRGRMKRVRPGEEEPKLGDCIDCNLCVAVCPTGWIFVRVNRLVVLPVACVLMLVIR